MDKRIKINGDIFNFSNDNWRNENSERSIFFNEILNFCEQWFDAKDFVLAKTSGSTGEPKEIKLPKKWMIASATKTIQLFCLNKNRTALLSLPVSFIAGKMMIVRAIVGELNLIFSEPSSTPIVPPEPIQFAAFTPMQCAQLLKADIASMHRIENCIVGGGAISSPLWQALSQFEGKFFATYGMTETATHIAFQQISPENETGVFTLVDREIRIGLDGRNCISFLIPYFDNLEIQTNDIAEIIDDTRFRIMGRWDRVVNSGGRKIHLDELEQKCAAIIPLPFFFCAVPDEILGQKLVLLIESNQPLDLNEINQKLEVLNKLDRPKVIESRLKFQYTHTGKIIKSFFYEK